MHHPHVGSQTKEERLWYGALSGESIYWFRDDALEGTSTGLNPFFRKPERGTHRITCSTLAGAAASVLVTIE
jgi:hypothetical protein